MFRGRRNEQWWHTSHVLAQLANLKFLFWRKSTKWYQPDAFNPVRTSNKPRRGRLSFTRLKAMTLGQQGNKRAVCR